MNVGGGRTSFIIISAVDVSKAIYFPRGLGNRVSFKPSLFSGEKLSVLIFVVSVALETVASLEKTNSPVAGLNPISPDGDGSSVKVLTKSCPGIAWDMLFGPVPSNCTLTLYSPLAVVPFERLTVKLAVPPSDTSASLLLKLNVEV